MRNRLGYAIVVTLLGASFFLSACNDDEDDPGDANGGENAAGEPSTGGSSAGKAGSTSGGKAGSSTGGSMTDAGAGGMSDAGAGGDGGMGGAAAGMGGANVGGAEGGAGGAENPVITYACTANSINHKACSALSAITCDLGIDCADCVAVVQEERDFFSACATCLAIVDKVYQCAIDAHESGMLSEGLQCLETAGPGSDTSPDYADVCYESFADAEACDAYASVPANGCPETWPPADG